DRFAEKLKKGSKEIALKMEYVPSSGEVKYQWTLLKKASKKASKMDFARVLVEVSVEDDLPNVLEIEYPPLGNKPARVGKLEVRPRTAEEIAAKTLKDVLNIGKSNVMDKGKSMTDDDGFTVVGKKNKPTASQFVNQAKRRVSGYVQGHQYQQKSNSNAGNVKSGRNFNNTSNLSVQKEKKKSIVDKPFLASIFNHNYRPKASVRGSGLDNVTNRPLNEDIPVNNPFNILSNKGDNVEDLGDINVNEEFESKVWPNLKEEVDIHLEAGDVDSDDEGITVNMKPEVDVNAVDNMEINAAFNDDISDDPAERSTGGSKFTTAMHDFRKCVEEIEVEDIAMTGLNFTWNKKPGKDGGLLKNLDRVLDEELFLRQKAKVEWLRAGNSNSSYFHNVIKGQSSEVLPFFDPDSLFMKKLPAVEALKLVRIISNEEIKLALFDIDGNKAPGPDEINATVISFVPKVAAPFKVSNYRPIACCNVVYKIISKVICNRLKGVLGFLVDDNQSAFILSRHISDNIMLSQELIRNYHRNRGPAKCAFKIDIEKAYDSVEWVFLSSSLKHFGFSELMVKWIMNCITSTSFTVNVNEVDAFLAVEDKPTSSDYYQSYLNPEGDILLLEAFLNDDPSPPPYQGNYMPEELPPHLEYAFLEGDDKLPVIIAKDLSVEEKTALITILKSHKRAITWKLSDIMGINPEFCTHKILMEEDFEPAIQHQRRVNPKIHDVIKQEVIKLLEAGLIHPISDSPWVSPVHCVPKKGGFTVVENEDNELISTRLVTR
nr:reverse transcriptase domain-containing protein [Tanacetum cinerariifolium]